MLKAAAYNPIVIGRCGNQRLISSFQLNTPVGFPDQAIVEEKARARFYHDSVPVIAAAGKDAAIGAQGNISGSKQVAVRSEFDPAIDESQVAVNG